MTPANPDALADALARELARLDGWHDPDALWTDNIGIIARGGEGSPAYLDYVEDAGKLISGPLAPILAAKEAAEARAAQLQAEVEAKDRAILLLLPFVDYAAGEGLMFVETEDGEHPEMDAADIMAAVAEALGLELGSDAYLSLLPKGYFAIRTALAARAATSVNASSNPTDSGGPPQVV